MRLSAILATAVLVCSSFSATASDESTARAALISAFEANDCKITLSQAKKAMEAAGLKRKLATPTAMALFNEGGVKFADNGDLAILITGQVCEGTKVDVQKADPVVRAAVIKLYEDNDCSIDPNGEPYDKLRDTYSDNAAELAIVELANENAITLDKDNSTLKIGDVCGK